MEAFDHHTKEEHCEYLPSLHLSDPGHPNLPVFRQNRRFSQIQKQQL